MRNSDWTKCWPMRPRSLLPARFVWTPGSLTSDNGSPKYNSLITWLKSYFNGFYRFKRGQSPTLFLKIHLDLSHDILITSILFAPIHTKESTVRDEYTLGAKLVPNIIWVINIFTKPSLCWNRMSWNMKISRHFVHIELSSEFTATIFVHRF